jgi:hypothetical protein
VQIFIDIDGITYVLKHRDRDPKLGTKKPGSKIRDIGILLYKCHFFGTGLKRNKNQPRTPEKFEKKTGTGIRNL